MMIPGAQAISLASLNALPVPQAISLLLRACGSQRWAAQLAASRPFKSKESLINAADEAWHSLSREDYLEAFAHHPRIGSAPPQKAPTAELSRREQSGMAAATPEARLAFAELNLQYEARFGHVFLICATGKSAHEMLAELRARLKNTPDTELANAAAEHAMITRLRLDKLVTP